MLDVAVLWLKEIKQDTGPLKIIFIQSLKTIPFIFTKSSGPRGKKKKREKKKLPKGQTNGS